MVDSDSPTTGLVMPDALLGEQQVEPDIEDFDTDPVGEPTTPHLDLSPLPDIGVEDLVGPYRLKRLIGEGGMGRVYLAAEAETGRVVALKVLKFVGQKTLQRRFTREGDVLERLDHPNIVRLLGRGTDERLGLSYLAFEHVPGRDLGVVLKSLPGRQLSIPEVVYVLERCARALTAAHALGILHRDIKLANVLVTPAAEVKLIDFGIALSDDASVRLSGRDEIMGTLNYIAPDVLQGRGWGPAADIYALGCLAFRTLTGRPAFPGRTPTEVIQAHQRGVPSLAAARADAPPGLCELLARMLAPVGEERPTAEQVVFALGHLGLANETVVVAREWSSGRLGLRYARHDPSQTEAFSERPPSLSASAEEVLAGRMIGPYRLVRPLGRGAMGEVYLVQHPELGTQYALKLLAAALVEDEEALARFQAEMANLAAVDAHPGIVRVHSSGLTESGRPYFAMEYVEGETLGQLLRRGLGPVRSLDLIEQVAEALAFAHARGLVHRDVKPDNVLVDESGRARLTDFGLAKAAEGRAQGLTRTGDTIGTPIYMSPEQGKSEHDRVGPWSDVFAVGAMLFEVFVGKPPYWAETAVEVYGKLIDGAPIPPARQAGAEIGPALEAVIQSALANDPEDRYPHSGALLEALREARQADEEGPRGRSILLPLGLLAAGVLVLVFLALLFAKGASSDDPTEAASIATAPEVDRTATVVAAWEAGKLEEAAALLGAVKGPFSLRHAILAASGKPAEALAATAGESVSPSTRAMLAAWAGDEPGFRAAAQELGAEATLALRWRWAEFLPGAPPDAWGGKGSAGWRLLARSEQALAEGAPALAAQLLHEAARSAEARTASFEGQVMWGRLRLAIARGRLAEASRAWEALQADVTSELDRARLRGWGVLLAKAHTTKPPAVLPTELGVAARLPIGQLVRGEGAEGARMRGAAFLQLGLRRGQVVLNLAEQGQVRAGAARAAALFAAAARLDPRSRAARVGLARAQLVTHEVPAAKAASAEALALAPGDAAALLVSARCSAAEIEGSSTAVEVDRAWARRRPRAEGEAELSERWGEAVEQFERALAAAEGPQRRRALLWLGHALVQRADHLQRAGRSTRAIAARVIALTEELSGRVPAVVEARARLGQALVSGEPRAIEAAERRLTEAAGPAEERLALARALYLRAVSNAPEAPAARQAYLALAGDLPALAVVALRRAERAKALRTRREALQHGLALAPRAAPLLLAVELLKLDKESVEPFGRDEASVRGLARAITYGPGATVAVLGALRASLPATKAQQRRLIERLSKPADALARTLLWVAMGGETSLRRGLLDAARAAQVQPTVAGELLRAIALSGTSLGKKTEIRGSLDAARAGAPLSHVVDLVTLHTDPNCEAGEVVEELLAWGFLSNYADLRIPPGAQDSGGIPVDLKIAIDARVRPAAKILRDFELRQNYAAGALTALEKSDLYRRLSFSVRLFLMAQRVGRARNEAKLEEGLALRPVEDRAHLEMFYRYNESRMEDRDSPEAAKAAVVAIRAAARALRERGPAGGCPQPVRSDWDLIGQRVDFKRTLGLPRSFRRSFPAHRLDVYGRLRPVAWLRFALVRAWEIAYPPEDGDPLLFEPSELRARWGRSRAALLGVQDGYVAEETLEWLVEEQGGAEIPLALIRSAAFRRTESFHSRYVDEVESALRRVRRLEPEEMAQPARAIAGLARYGLRWTTSKTRRGSLHEHLADALLIQAGGASAAERKRLGGLAYTEATAALELRGNGDDRWVLWRLARAAGAKGDLVNCRKHLAKLRAALGRRRHSLREAVESDPLSPHLKTIPEYQAFVDSLKRRRGHRGRRDRED